LYLNREVHRKSASTRKYEANHDNRQSASPVAALRIDFVTKPGGTSDIASEVANLLAQTGFDHKGLKASMVLVSDREPRLVTLLTLWDAERFNPARDRLTSWTLRLLAPLADKPPRAHTSVAHFLFTPASSELTLSDLRPTEIAELVEILAAG